MQTGMIGLGKMGGNMTRRVIKAGHNVIIFARTVETREELRKHGAIAGKSIEYVVSG